jgi:hypothetical protein
MFATILTLSAVALVHRVDKTDYPPPGDYRHDFELTQSYSKFNDYTILRIEFGAVWSDSKNELELDIHQFFDGEGRSKPSGNPQFRFVNTGRASWRYLTYHPIIFLVDGERFRFDPEHDGSVKTDYVLEFLYVRPTKNQLLKMIYARKVEVQVGADQFELTESHLNAMKDFTSYLGNPYRRLSTPAIKRALREARALETEVLDESARQAFQTIVDQYAGSYEATKAAEAIKRLNDPARKDAYKKSIEFTVKQAEAMVRAKAKQAEAAARTKAREERAQAEEALKLKIEQYLRSGRALEDRNPKAALSYYKDILKLAVGLSSEPPEVKKARSRIKALSGIK